MWWITGIGLLAIIMSFFYFFRPEQIKKLDEFGNKVIVSTEKLLEKRMIIGLFCLIAGIAMIYIAFWWEF
jgi:uncharacterized membrane protein HdeD (DUF308 family)